MNVCDICKERFMCDRLLYDCPRSSLPEGTEDELSDDDKREWAKTYIRSGYSVPKELQKYTTER